MTSHPSDQPVRALRARMIEDMTVRGFNEQTRSNYIRNVRAFAAFISRSPDTATAEDLRRFQHHQAQTGVALARQLLGMPAAPSSSESDGAEGAHADAERNSCPCCGGRMVIIETFEPGCQPRLWPLPSIGLDSS